MEYLWNRSKARMPRRMPMSPEGMEAGYFKICSRWVKGWRFTLHRKAIEGKAWRFTSLSEGKGWQIIDGKEDKTACHFIYKFGRFIPGKYPFKTELRCGLPLSEEEGYKYPKYNRQKLLREILKREPSILDKPIIITTNNLAEIEPPKSSRDRFYLDTEERYMLRLVRQFQVIRFRKARVEDIYQHLCRILHAEKVPYRVKTVHKIAAGCSGNIRQAIDFLQVNKDFLQE
jgi:hypothetical protein